MLEERVTKRAYKPSHEPLAKRPNQEKKPLADDPGLARKDEKGRVKGRKRAEREITPSNALGFPQVPISSPSLFGTASNLDPLPFNRLAMRVPKDELKLIPQLAGRSGFGGEELQESYTGVAEARGSSFNIGPYAVYPASRCDRIGIMHSESQTQSTDFDYPMDDADEDPHRDEKQSFDYISANLAFDTSGDGQHNTNIKLGRVQQRHSNVTDLVVDHEGHGNSFPSHDLSSFPPRRGHGLVENNTRGRPKAIPHARMESVLSPRPIKLEFKTRVDRCPGR
jgi:hypothetical protein